ncbi:aminoacyl-tRNA deacylase [Citricoccus sp. SGAir0253]|uniref:aminoacyl-tRNA deacylase n=1 Tax=Citricoccus sp. SGAir0253 TaxID=2567881 RepID=UPI001FF0721E|nr:aminoacyl-tRNA deacylase [Citricoccus sp. SGAir0253]
MRATPALAVLERAGVEHEVLGFDRSGSASGPGRAGAPSRPSYGAEAAERLGLDPALVFKTLMVQCPDASLAAAVVPVSGSLDLRATAAALGVKRVGLADPAAAERRTGYVVGGISPLGQRRPARTVLDASALGHPRVYVSAGQRGLDVGLAPADLAALTGAVVAPIAAAGPPR